MGSSVSHFRARTRSLSRYFHGTRPVSELWWHERVDDDHPQPPLLGLQGEVGPVEVPPQLGVDAQRGVARHHHEQFVEAVHVGGQAPVREEAVAVHDAADGVEGDLAVEHAEDPADADGPACALGQAPLRHQARRPPLGEVDVLVDEHHELVARLLDPGVEPFGRGRTAAEDEELVGAAGRAGTASGAGWRRAGRRR